MKKIFYTLLATIALPFAFVNADDYSDLGNDGHFYIEGQEHEMPGPFKLKLAGDWLGRSKIEKHRFKNQHLQYNTAEAELGLIYYYDPCNKEAANVELTYTLTNLDWHENPFFDKERFNTVSLTFGYLSKRLCDWLWRAQFAINVDGDHFNLTDYGTYDFLLWGRYDYCQDIGLHIGIIGLTGMKITHVYPVIGIDWTMDCHWKFNFVFPVDLSIIYTINQTWSAFAAGRFFDSRLRADKHSHLSMAVIEYRNAGLELGVKYEYKKILDANIHAGYATGGRLKIADRHYNHRRHINFGGSPYLGGEVVVRF